MTRLTVRVQPGARRTGLAGRLADGTLKVSVTAPPEKGRANEAVVECLSELLRVKSRQIRLVAGAASRTKVFAVEGLEPEALERRIAAALATGDKD